MVFHCIIVSQYEAKIKIFSLWSLDNSKPPVIWHYPGKEHWFWASKWSFYDHSVCMKVHLIRDWILSNWHLGNMKKITEEKAVNGRHVTILPFPCNFCSIFYHIVCHSRTSMIGCSVQLRTQSSYPVQPRESPGSEVVFSNTTIFVILFFIMNIYNACRFTGVRLA